MSIVTQNYANLSDFSFGLFKKDNNLATADVRQSDLTDLEFLTQLVNEDTITLFGDIDGAMLL